MTATSEAAGPEDVLEFVDLVLRTAGDLTRFGDRVAGVHGLSAARSLVLGALDGAPASIADVARRRGLRRQSVQESMQRLERDGLVCRVLGSSLRSPVFELTEAGRGVRQGVHAAFWDWAGDAARQLDGAALAAATVTLQGLLTHDAGRGSGDVSEFAT